MTVAAPRSSAPPRRRSVVTVLVALAGGVVCGLALVGRLEASIHTVSQKGRLFQPGSMVVMRGDTITIVNDDQDLLHHVYIDSENFTFDSGDQEPGSRTPVTFTEKGSFQVLCGIHPKMKLAVRVN
jgi:plastocyanin